MKIISSIFKCLYGIDKRYDSIFVINGLKGIGLSRNFIDIWFFINGFR